CGSKNLPESLVLHEIKSAIVALIDVRNKNRATVGETKLIASKRRDPTGIGGRWVVKVIACVKSRVAHEFEDRTVKPIGAAASYDVGKSRSAAADFSRHPSRAGLQLLHRIHIKVGKSRSAHLRIA